MPVLQNKMMEYSDIPSLHINNGFKASGLKAVLFDMDGVLFDSMPRHAKAWVRVCRDHGLNISDADIVTLRERVKKNGYSYYYNGN